MNKPGKQPRRRLSLPILAWPLAAHLGTRLDVAPTRVSLASRMKLLLVTGLYVAALLWAYATIVSPAFSYDGCTLTWPGGGAMVWLITLALLPSPLMPYSLLRPSALILWWLYIAVYIPSILVPALTLSMPFEQLLPLHISLLLCMVFFCFVASGRLLAIPRIAISPALFWPTFLLIWGGCLGYVWLNGRMNLVSNILSLFQGATEYTIRGGYHDLVLEVGRLLAYVVGQLGNALNPFLMAWGLVNRRKFCLLAGILGQIVVFSLTGFKAALFSVVILSLLALLAKRWWRSFGLAFTLGLIATIFVCSIADHATSNVLFSSKVTRRALVVPGLLTGFYYEHYTHFSPVGLGFHFARDEDFVGPANAIGLAYFGSLDVNANANLWAEGFAELGLPGIFAFTILVALMIWLYDSISARHEQLLAVLLAVMPAMLLSNTSPLTVLISHGAVGVALALYLSPLPKPAKAPEPETEPEQSPLLPMAETVV